MMNPQHQKLLIRILIILGVVSLGLLVVNQSLSYYYKAQFLQSPCQLCLEINKDLDLCKKNEIKNINDLNLSFDKLSITP